MNDKLSRQNRPHRLTGIVGLPEGERPFRVYIDAAQDGAEEVFRIGDRIRREFYRTVGYEELRTPALN